MEFTPSVATSTLTVVMDATWTMQAELADGNITEFTACWQQATAKWYCNFIMRTQGASDTSTDERNVYIAVVEPAAADFTANVSFKTTTGYSESKYTLTSSCASTSTANNAEPALSGSCSTNSADFVF